MNSFMVSDARVVKTMIPCRDKAGKRPYILGTKIVMGDGSWWMFSKRHMTWTRHSPGLPAYHKSGSPLLGDDMKPVVGKERVESFGSTAKLRRTMGHCPRLLDALRDGLLLAT